jgi:hypothetical protein
MTRRSGLSILVCSLLWACTQGIDVMKDEALDAPTTTPGGGGGAGGEGAGGGMGGGALVDAGGVIATDAAPRPDAPPTCVPGPEICDGIDNDCDGARDEGLPALAGGFAPATRLIRVDGTGETLRACAYVACGELTCEACGTVTLTGATLSGSFYGGVRTLTGEGASLKVCGDVPCGESSCYSCESFALTHATAAGGLSAIAITGLEASGRTLSVGGLAVCPGDPTGELTCPTSGVLTLTCAP